MLVVSAITGAVLYFAQRNAELDAQRSLQREFQGEFAALMSVQEMHRAAIAERCRALAKSVRIRAALEESDVADLYRNAAIELRDVIENEPGTNSERSRFFRFLDAEGAVLSPAHAEEPEHWESQLALPTVPEEQQVGYIVGESGGHP
jgi:hypothetical protein